MKLILRWYKNNHKVPLEYIKQIPGIYGVCSSLDDLPIGEPWPEEAINALKEKINNAGLQFTVVESVPVHESIKAGLPNRDYYIENYRITLRNLTLAGVEVACFNFMPLYDWFRTDLDYLLADGSKTMAYDAEKAEEIDPSKGVVPLPGWAKHYRDMLPAELLDTYSEIDADSYRGNLRYFLEGLVDVLAETGIKLALHPDDPPWPIFSLPRIAGRKTDLERYLDLVESPQLGLAFCTGSLGAEPSNDLPAMVQAYGNRGKIFFAHIRNIKHTGHHSFVEVAHADPEGSFDIPLIIKELYDTGYSGYIRPDHGRTIWGEDCEPGYGLYDRALGAAYISGIWTALHQAGKTVC